MLRSYSISASQPSHSPAAFEEAVKSLKEKAGAAPVLILVGNTDTLLRFPGLDDLRNGLEKEGISLLTILDRGSDKPAFIAALDMPHRAKLGTKVQARVGIANTGSEVLTGELRLAADGAVILGTTVRLPAQSIQWQELRVTPQNKGLTKYEVVLSMVGREAMEDKVGWELLAFDVQQVVVLASTSSATPGYLEKALRASPLVGTVTVVEPESLDAGKFRQLLSSSHVVVLDGVNAAVFPADLGAELKGWTESGGMLVFAGGAGVTEAWNKNNLGAVLPVSVKMRKDKLLQGVVVGEHPITRGLELESTPLSVSRWVSVDKTPQEQVLVSGGGEPMLLWRKQRSLLPIPLLTGAPRRKR